MTLETALRALSEAEARVQHAETRVHELEGERQRLALRVKDLEQQLGARAAPLAVTPDPAVLSFFQESVPDPEAASAVSGMAPMAAAVRSRSRETVPRPRGRQPLDPA